MLCVTLKQEIWGQETKVTQIGRFLRFSRKLRLRSWSESSPHSHPWHHFCLLCPMSQLGVDMYLQPLGFLVPTVLLITGYRRLFSVETPVPFPCQEPEELGRVVFAWRSREDSKSSVSEIGNLWVNVQGYQYVTWSILFNCVEKICMY